MDTAGPEDSSPDRGAIGQLKKSPAKDRTGRGNACPKGAEDRVTDVKEVLALRHCAERSRTARAGCLAEELAQDIPKREIRVEIACLKESERLADGNHIIGHECMGDRHDDVVFHAW